MQINTPKSLNSLAYDSGRTANSQTLKEKIQSGEISAKEISKSYLLEYTLKVKNYSSQTLQIQSSTSDIDKAREILKNIDYEAVGYTGKPIIDMQPDEAMALVSEDGFFGVSKTSERLAHFVLTGGGDDIERLKAGREGIERGFKEAEKLWGGKLPDISYQTLDKALATIDEKITSLGGTLLDTTA